ncbi:protocadherin Fat 2 [Sorex fumeus]|uniref:protocadherin Fat 2 n=1 Tax=Sorex fumeus TaxID=62283 RepID=UPI0024ACE553|nr:protocadherin Fat 2 [Sorex fumeus]
MLGALWTALLCLPLAAGTEAPGPAWRFTHALYNATIYENSAPRTYVDSPVRMGVQLTRPGVVVRFRILQGDTGGVFRAEEHVVGDFCFLRLRTRAGSGASALNREVRDTYSLLVQAAEAGGTRVQRARVAVHVLDRNDLKPLFSPPSYRVAISEDTAPRTPICQVTATDADLGPNAEFYYVLPGRPEALAVHPTTGMVTLAGRLGATAQADHEFHVLAVDRARPGLGTPARLTVHVDPAPRLTPTIASVLVAPADGAEDGALASVLLDTSAPGADALEVVAGDPDGYFKAVVVPGRSHEFRLLLARELNWLQHREGFNLSLRARARGPPAVQSPTLAFHLPAAGLAALRFEQELYRVQLSELSPPGRRVLALRVPGAPPSLRFTLQPSPGSSFFRLHPHTGLLSTAATLDWREHPHFRLQVQTVPPLASATVLVDVLDANNHAPVFNSSSYEAVFDENLPVGTRVLTVVATDRDQGDSGRVSYSIVGRRAVPFEIEPFLGVITTSRPLDYELTQRLYAFRVRASDWGSPFRRETDVSVSLRLQNANDNRPVFQTVGCVGALRRDWPVSGAVATVLAIDIDELQPLRYEFVSGNELHYFDLHPLSGLVSLRRALPPGPARFLLEITAFDGKFYAAPMTLNLTVVPDAHLEVPVSCVNTGVLAQFAKAILGAAEGQEPPPAVGVDDDDDFGAPRPNLHAPLFKEPFPQSIEVPEQAPPGTPLAHLAAMDPDAGFAGQLVYMIAGGDDGGHFDVDLESGQLTVAAPLDYEATRGYSLNVTVHDLGSPPRSSWKLLDVIVRDCNDHAPRFPPGGYQLSVMENTAVGSTVAELRADDADTEDNGSVRYMLLSPTEHFSVHPLTGQLVVTGALDRESQPQHALKVEARDQPRQGLALFSVADVLVTLEDANDHAPQCVPELLSLRVPEDLPSGTVLALLDAPDPDLGPAGEVRFTLKDDAHGTFRLHPDTGALSLEAELDFERRASYNLSVWASDGGQPQAQSTLCHVEVTVLDVDENFHPPRFASFVRQGQVQENSPAGTEVLAVAALDEDTGLDGELRYSLRAGTSLAAFAIDPHTGVIRTLERLDRERVAHYWLTVQAADRGSRPRSAVTEVYIEVTDVNDNAPHVSRPVFYPVVREDVPPHSPVMQLDAQDADAGLAGTLRFNLTGGNALGLFALDPDTGLLSTARQLDREVKEEHILEVAVQDQGEPPQRCTCRVVVQVEDANDSPPAFPHKLFTVRLPESLGAPGPLYRLVAADPDAGPNGHVTYSIQDSDADGFVVEPTTGVVWANRSFRAGDYNILTVKATDGGQPALSASVRLHVEWIPQPPASTTPLAFEEPHYSFTVMETDPVNHMVGVVTVQDRPGLLWFSISGGDENMDFDVDKVTGSLLIAKPLDTRRRSNYNLTVAVTDGAQSITTQVHVSLIANVNRHRPQFLEAQYEVRVPANTPPGVQLLHVQATDPDPGKGLIYTIHGSQDPGSSGLFQLEPSTGALVTVADLGPGPSQHTLTVMVRDQEMPIKRNFVWVLVCVEAGNLHPPRFTQPQYEASVVDTAAPGTEVLQLRALDGDWGPQADVHYSLLKGNSAGLFALDALLGTLTLAQTLPVAGPAQHTLTVRAEDRGSPPRHDLATVLVHVHPSPSSAPRFSQAEYFVEVPESVPVGSPILRVVASAPSQVSYELVDGGRDAAFTLNPYSGLLCTHRRLDHEAQASHRLRVRGHSMAGTFVDIPVLVSVLDANDHAPEFSQLAFEGHVSEAALPGSLVTDESHNPLVLRAADGDGAGDALLTFMVLEPEVLRFFQLDPGMGTLSTAAGLDHEHAAFFRFRVYVHDHGMPVLYAPQPAWVTVRVGDVNDCPPHFSQQTYEVDVVGPVHPGMGLLTVHADDPDSTVTYGLEAGNADGALTLHPGTGQLWVASPSRLGAGRELTVGASDGLYRATALLRLRVLPATHTDLRFEQDTYEAAVPENEPGVRALLLLRVVGARPNDSLAFALLNGTNHFHMARSAGVLRTRGEAFDREQQDAHMVAVEVRDGRVPPRVAQALVRVSVEDANDHRPEFQHLPYEAVVPEGAEPGDVLLQVSATDRDEGAHAAITYAFAEDYAYFRIDPFLGDISLRKPLDYRALNSYRLGVVASDGGSPPLRASAEVRVLVRNQTHPLFQSPRYSVRVPEDVPRDTPVLHTQARSPEGHPLVYHIPEAQAPALVAVNFRTGMVSVTGPLDHEAETRHVFRVRATDTALGAFSEATVELLVEDVNDNAPAFSRPLYTAAVAEGLPAHTPVIQLLATDPDAGRNRDISYHIVDGDSDASSFFEVDAATGQLSTARELDYESRPQFQVRVRATDGGDPPLSGETLVVVQVTDVNDNPPAFEQPQYEARVSSLAACGHPVLRVQALDADPADAARLHYLILSGDPERHFAINRSSGVISMPNLCKRLLDASYSLRVGASDGAFRATVPVYINTTATNAHSPAFPRPLYEAELAENAAAGTEVAVLQAVDGDSGPFGEVEYLIINRLAAEKFAIGPGGHVYTLRELDRENATERVVALRVMARDGGGRAGFCTLRVILTDENDNAPRFSAPEYTVSVPANASRRAPVLRVLAYDADEGRHADVTYSVAGEEAAVVDVEPISGLVRVKESLAGLENHTVGLTLRAQDGAPPHRHAEARLHLQVVPSQAALPRFSEPLYTFSAAEDLAEGTAVGSVRAEAGHEPVIYSLVQGATPESNRDGAFTLEPHSGLLRVGRALDYEDTRWYQLDLLAHCPHGDTRLLALASVHVQVVDVNDNRPIFEADPYRAVLTENMPAGTAVIQVTAGDRDSGRGGQVSYRLRADPVGRLHELFAVDSETGWVRTLRPLDCESAEHHHFHVEAHDHGQAQLSSRVLVEVTVTDENDNPPRFAASSYRGAVVENGEPEEPVVALRVSDADVSAPHRQVTCYITEGDPLGLFGIRQVGDEWTVFSRRSLDREHMAKHLLRVTASDGKFQASVPVEVLVLDVNDNSPVCAQLLYSGHVQEDAAPGHSVLQVSASDADADANAQVSFSLHGPGAHDFHMDPHTGQLSTLAALDREQKAEYSLVVKATDGGGRWCEAAVTLRVDDVNDNAPRFSPPHCAVVVSDNTTLHAPVAVLLALDADQGPNAQVVYALSDSADGRFSIEPRTGVLRLDKPLGAAPQAPLQLTVRASDLGTPIPLSTLGTVTVSVVSRDDHLPVFLGPEHSVRLPEDAPLGTEVLRLDTLTRPGPQRAAFRLVSGNEQGHFRLDTHSGVLYVNGSLDFETTPRYFLSIEGSRTGVASLGDITTLVVNITDINEHWPRFLQDAYHARVPEDAPVGRVVLTVSAVDQDGAPGRAITYSLVGGDQHGHFAVHPENGQLTVARALDWEQASGYSLRLRATDSGRPPLHQDTSVTIQVLDVNDNPPRFFQLNYSATVQENSPIGRHILQLVLSDSDSPENGPPFSFRITRGNEASVFQVTPDGRLLTAASLSRSVQDQYQLQIEASDSGKPALTSSTSVSVRVIARSLYPPSTLSLDIFITLGEAEFPGGLVGKIHATDRDPQDTLTYSLGAEAPNTHFSVGPADGTVLGAQGLPCGHHAFNVTVSDGNFAATASVHVHVWRAEPDALQRSMWLGFQQLSPEELVSDHWRNLQRFLGQRLDVGRAGIHLASLQPAEAGPGVDMLLVFEGHSGTFHQLQDLAAAISHSAPELEQAVGVQLRAAVPMSPCQGAGCRALPCRETVQLEPVVGPPYSTARISVLSPRHRRLRCGCNGTAAEFRGQSIGRYRLPGAPAWDAHFRLRTGQAEATVLRVQGPVSLSLQLADGALRLELHCPGGYLGNLSSERRLSDGQWHAVRLEVTGEVASLQVDGSSATLEVPGSCRGPRPESELVLGGHLLPPELPRVSHGFQGCLDAVAINGAALDMLGRTEAGWLERRALSPCCPPDPKDGACSPNPCANGGQCTPHPAAGFLCQCPPGFWGQQCQQGQNCSSPDCPDPVACTPPGGAPCGCPYPQQGERCDAESRGCAAGSCLVTPAVKSGDWGQQELLLLGAALLLVLAAAAGLLLYRRRRRAHKPVAREDPDLLARSVGVGTQAPPIQLGALGTGAGDPLAHAEPGKASELVTFGPSSRHRPVVCSVPPRLPPAAPPSRAEAGVKRTWSGEALDAPTAWPPAYCRKDAGPPQPVPYGGFPFPLELGNKRAPLPPRYSHQDLDALLAPGPGAYPGEYPGGEYPREYAGEYTAVSYYHARLPRRAGPAYADGDAGVALPPGRGGQRPAPPHYAGSDQVESDYGSCEEVMF